MKIKKFWGNMERKLKKSIPIVEKPPEWKQIERHASVWKVFNINKWKT